jgi:hypothetical protein
MNLVGAEVAVAVRVAGSWLAAIAALHPTAAASQSATAQQTSSADASDDPGGDYAKPQNLFQLLYEYKTAPGAGAATGTVREVTTDTVNLRLDQKIDVDPQWTIALRGDLPLIAKNPISSGNPNGDYVYGVGDADAQVALIYKIDARWTAALGARLIAPTGDDLLGAGKWQVMPGMAVRYALSEISPGSYFEPLLRYDASFAGDPSRRSISNLQFAPTFNLGLPDRWFVALYPSPEIRINYGPPIAGQTGRLFVPFDVRVGRKLADNVAVSLEVSVPIIKDYPIYNFKSQVRLNLSF